MSELGVPKMEGERAPYVTFKTMPQEDIQKTKALGRYVAKDVEFACITPMGTRDMQIEELPDWWDKLDQQVRAGRFPSVWVDHWKAAYDKWKAGQEIPIDGTPIKGWAMISQAQQETLIAANVRTVEDLAKAHADAIKHIGMGAVALKRMATTWLTTAKDRGPLTKQLADLQQENDQLKVTVQSLETKVQELKRQLDATQVAA